MSQAAMKAAGGARRMIGKPTHKNQADCEFANLRNPDPWGGCTIIPENRFAVRPGYYSHGDMVKLLRSACRRPGTVRFIADIME